MSKAQERARQYLGIYATEREAGLYELGYEQAIEDAIAYLKANAEKFIVDCTPTYPDASQELKIGGMLYEHLRQSLTDD